MLHTFVYFINPVSESVYSVDPAPEQFCIFLFEGKLPKGSFYESVTFVCTDKQGKCAMFIFIAMFETMDFNMLAQLADAYMEAMVDAASEDDPPFNPSLN